MPNTFSHVGVQLLAGRAVAGSGWNGEWLALSLLGCLIPDLPWIVQRAIRPFLLHWLPSGEFGWPVLLGLRSWCVGASSLACCLLLCIALSQLFTRRSWALVVLSSGCALHLLLDGLQTKWGNGVILAAPFLWETWRADLFWPESLPSTWLTGWGLLVAGAVSVALRGRRPISGQEIGALPAWRPHWKGPRVQVMAVVFGAYLVVPLAADSALRRADAHSLGVLAAEERVGRPVELHRAAFTVSGDPRGRVTVRTLHEEVLELEGPAARTLVASGQSQGRASIRGVFVGRSTITGSAVHVHVATVRATLSIAGVLLISVWLGLLVWRGLQAGQVLPRGVDRSEE